jgi:hypothetical protein
MERVDLADPSALTCVSLADGLAWLEQHSGLRWTERKLRQKNTEHGGGLLRCVARGDWVISLRVLERMRLGDRLRDVAADERAVIASTRAAILAGFAPRAGAHTDASA